MKATAPLVAIALLLSSTAAAPADQGQATLGAGGKLYQVLSGTYGDLFPDAAGQAEHSVLALEISVPGEEPVRLLVPGTEDSAVESSPALVFEDSSDGIFLIWESRTSFIHSQIKLASYLSEAWSDPILLPGEFFSLKTSPSLAVTRDTFVSVGADGTPSRHSRTIYHTVWWEEAASGERVVYSPVVLLDGVYIGWNPLFVLNDLDFGDEAAGPFLASETLSQAPSIFAGSNDESVVVGLVDQATRQLVELEISVVPGELGALASELEWAVTEAGESLYPHNLRALGDRARAHLIDFGLQLRLNPFMLDYLAVVGAAGVATGDPAEQSLSSFAQRARAHLIDFGARMRSQTLSEAADREVSTWLLEFGSGDESGFGETPPHSLAVILGAVREIPWTGKGATSLYVSPDAREATVAWQGEDDRLYFTESTGDEWSEVRYLQLTDDLDLNRAHDMLEQRTHDR